MTETASRIQEAVGEQLAGERRFVSWKLVLSEDGEEQKKLPINPRSGSAADVTDPKTWGTLTEALERAERDGLSGVGVVFTEEDDLGGIDLDGCRDPESGELEGWAEQFLQRYPELHWEVSPSETGLKGIGHGAPDELPSHSVSMNTPPKRANGRKKDSKVEASSSSRYYTITGRHIEGTAEQMQGAGGESWGEKLADWLREHGSDPYSGASGDWRDYGYEPVGEDGIPPLPSRFWKALDRGDHGLLEVWDGEKGGDDTSRSAHDAALANRMAEAGFSDPEIESALRRSPHGQIASGDLPSSEEDRQIRKLIGKARMQWGEPEREHRREVVNREPLSVGDLLKAGREPTEYLAEPVVPVGSRGLMVGLPGVGKTNYNLQTAVQLAAGDKLFGYFEVPEPRRVLALFAQDGPKVIGQRLDGLLRGLRLQKEDLEDRLRTLCRPTLRLTDEDDMTWLREEVESHEADLLILDSYKYISTGSENKAEDVNANLSALTRLQDATGVTILLVHHARKPGEADWGIRRIFTASGSVEFPAWTTVGIHCSAEDFGEPIEVVPELWDEPENVEEFELHWDEGEDGAFCLVHEKISSRFLVDQDEELRKAVERVRRYLKEYGPVSKSMAIGASSRDAPQPTGKHETNERALEHLIKQGEVEVERKKGTLWHQYVGNGGSGTETVPRELGNGGER